MRDILSKIWLTLKIHLGLFITVLVLIFVVFPIAFYHFFISAPANFPINKVISIEKGASFKKVAADFKEQNLVRSAFWFDAVGWVLRSREEVKAGEYFFEEPLNALDLFLYVVGNTYINKFLKITVLEGFTLRDIAHLFEDKGIWEEGDLWDVAGLPAIDCRSYKCPEDGEEFKKESSLLRSKPEYVSLEGFLFPDTYYVPLDISPEAMVEIMLKNLEKKVDADLRNTIDESGHSFYEILTMASLLEKEASKKEDRDIISGILWKRIDHDMALQIDAVFPYFINKYSLQLTTKDLYESDSPYNTYLYKGLPLGPIANPSLSAIESAVNPKETSYWFYLSDREGTIHYAATYEEHIANRKKYLGK